MQQLRGLLIWVTCTAWDGAPGGRNICSVGEGWGLAAGGPAE
jgi:hypothetical protein